MMLLWVALLVLHRGYTLAPVTTVHLGEPVNFTCALPNVEITRRDLHWYKQGIGETLKLIVRWRQSTKPVFSPEFSEPRLMVNTDNNFSNLTIVTTIQEDEGMYHCAILDWSLPPIWSMTYLLLKGSTQRTSSYTVVEWPTESDPVHPEDLMTLQCSVLSDSENKMCPGDHSVFWFRAESEKSRPDVIFTDRNKHNKCEKRSDTQKSCFYRSSKSISSSDAGTYYCAVATCEEILFGDVTKLQSERTARSEFIALLILIVCLVISVIGNIVCICYRTSRPVCSLLKGTESGTSQERHDNSSQPVHDITEGEPDLNYAALHFSGNKATRGRMKKEVNTEESVYSQVKCRM